MTPFAFALCAALAGAAPAQVRPLAPWWSISAQSAESARLPLHLGNDAVDDGLAWALAVRYRLPAGTFRLGYGQRDPFPAGRPWSIGYRWPLSPWSGGRLHDRHPKPGLATCNLKVTF